MSFIDLKDCFKEVAAYTDEGAVTLSVLKAALGHFKQGAEQFATATLKAHSTLKEGLTESKFPSTLSAALTSLTQSFRDTAQQYSNFASALQGNIIEPIDLFYEYLASTNLREKQRGLQMREDLQKAKEHLRSVRTEYYQRKADAEEAQTEARIRTAPINGRELQIEACKADSRYRAIFRTVESMWADFYEQIPLSLQTMQENEESRIHFLKTTLEKLTTQHLNVVGSLSGSLKGLSSVIGKISSNFDLKKLVSCLEDNHIPEERDMFIPFEAWRAQCTNDLKDEAFIILKDEQNDPEQNLALIERLLDDIFNDDTTELNHNRLEDLLVFTETREEIITQIELRRSEVCYSIAAIFKLASLCNTLLTALMRRGELDNTTFHRMVRLSQNFYCQTLDGRRKYLSSLVSSHCLWSDTSRWEKCIEMLIINRTEKDRRHQSKGFFRTFVDNLPAVIFGGKEAKPEKTMSFNVISQFNFYMINMRLPLETASDIVLKICKKFKLDPERTTVLLAELQANQRGNRSNAKDSKASLRYRRKASLLWGSFLPISLASEFLDCRDLRTMLVVCKDWRLKLTKVSQWRTLQEATPYSANEVYARKLFWTSQTKPSLKTLNYLAISRDAEENLESIQKLADIIKMDLKRCFHNTSGISHECLGRVLRAYAFYDPAVGYCQGMNYVAGALYLVTQSEEGTFKALAGMIEKHRMSSLYNSNMPRLKLMLYQLDRLIGIYLPELHRVFKDEMIPSSHYASSWFITLFASTLSTSQEHLHVLLQIWDCFFEEGWKAIFKCALAVLMRLSEELAAGKLENALILLSKIGSPLCPIPVFGQEFIGRMKSIRVSSSLLRDLESEYEHLKLRASMLPL